MLRPEEKQFGPWIHLTQDKYQKPLTVTVAKNGDSRIREEGAEIREHRKDGITVVRRQPIFLTTITQAWRRG